MSFNTLQDKKILITGGTGFIGRRLVAMLSDMGATCYVLTRQHKENYENVCFVQGDLNSLGEDDYKNIVQEYGDFDAAVYMAANIPVIGQKKENYVEAMSSTLYPTVKFSQSVCNAVKKFIYISSVDVVGIPQKADYDETVDLNPTTPYGVAKLAGEIYLKSLAAASKIDLTILRFSQVYGTNEPLVRIIPILLNTIKNDEIFNLYGSGEEKRRFLFVDDACSAIIKSLQSASTGTFNIAGKSVDSINDLIADAQKIFEKKLKLNKIETGVRTFDNIPNINNAEVNLDYHPQFSLYEGLERIFNELQ